MNKLVPSNQFKRDAKKLLPELLTAEWTTAAFCLIQGQPLPDKYKDHLLTGNWSGFRECHIKPDLLLIYAVTDGYVELARLGSHSELF